MKRKKKEEKGRKRKVKEGKGKSIPKIDLAAGWIDQTLNFPLIAEKTI
jgi:hypothetical protein